MSIATVLILLLILEVATPLLTEGIKIFLNSIKVKYISNVIVLLTAFVLSVGLSILYCLQQGINFTALTMFYIIFVFIANWLGSMLGYDKVKQALAQIKDKE